MGIRNKTEHQCIIMRLSIGVIIVLLKTSSCKIKMKESQIFTIKMPPSPYQYKQGVGYVSNPDSDLRQSFLNFGRTGLNSVLTGKNKTDIINIATKFLSNGKPFSVDFPTKESENDGTESEIITTTEAAYSPATSEKSWSTTTTTTVLPSSSTTTMATSVGTTTTSTTATTTTASKFTITTPIYPQFVTHFPPRKPTSFYQPFPIFPFPWFSPLHSPDPVSRPNLIVPASTTLIKYPKTSPVWIPPRFPIYNTINPFHV